MVEEIRKPGYTVIRDDIPKMKDMSPEEFVNFRKEVRKFMEEAKEKMKRLTDDIHGIKMQLGRMKKK